MDTGFFAFTIFRYAIFIDSFIFFHTPSSRFTLQPIALMKPDYQISRQPTFLVSFSDEGDFLLRPQPHFDRLIFGWPPTDEPPIRHTIGH